MNGLSCEIPALPVTVSHSAVTLYSGETLCDYAWSFASSGRAVLQIQRQAFESPFSWADQYYDQYAGYEGAEVTGNDGVTWICFDQTSDFAQRLDPSTFFLMDKSRTTVGICFSE